MEMTMGPNWYEKAMDELDRQYEAGEIDYGTYHNEQRELSREFRDAAEEAGRDAYDDYLERW
jgi:hypothetical protein